MSIISEALKKAREARNISTREAEASPVVFHQAPVARAPRAPSAPRVREEAVAGSPATRRNSTLAPIFAMAMIAVVVALGVFALGRGGTAQLASIAESSEGSATVERREGSAQFGVEQVLLPARSTRAPAPSPTPFSGYKLSGIAAFQDHFVAVVNGHVVKAGDRVSGAKVIAITAEAVELSANGQQLIIEMND